MPRSSKKGPFIDRSLRKAVEKAVAEGAKAKPIKTKSRRSMITPAMVGLTIGVHNGRTYVSVVIRADMVGRKLGEYAATRTYPKHPTDRKTG